MHLIEFLQDNSIQIACVLESQNGKVRALLPNRRELSLQENRILPWVGPTIPALDSKDEIVKVLNSHLEKRKQLSEEVETLDIWEMTQGEVDKADIIWLTELIYSTPTSDVLAGVARALIQDKVHFRFSPPQFEIYPAALVEAKKEAEIQQKQRERFVEGGMSWFKTLWDCRQNNKVLPECTLDEEVQERLKKILRVRIADNIFENKDDEILWRDCIKAVPDDAFAPLLLAMTWKIVPEHYNYWLDRAGYDVSEDWHKNFADDVAKLKEKAQNDSSPIIDLPFVSIDGATTKDIDDAFYLERKENCWEVHLALACPAAFWEFDSPFDKLISQRGTSLYLPEATYHMLPEELGIQAYSLIENTYCPSLVVKFELDFEGNLLLCEPMRAKVSIKHNLTYSHVEKVLDGEEDSPFAEMFNQAREMTELLLQKRIANNAIIIDRPDPQIKIEWKDSLPAYYEGVEITLEEMEQASKAQLMVSELMVLANSEVAQWAKEREIPLLHRTQDIALPKEYAGIWSRPEDIARIARSLASATLEVQARPHAGMGLSVYAPITSPLRRYADLINEAQILSFIESGTALFSKERLTSMILILNSSLEAVSQVQRMRPRYWKLLYFKQRSRKALEDGNDYIWKGVITEEYDHFVSVALPCEQMFLRAKRNIFPDKTTIGQEILVRLGKINPLKNEFQVIGVEEIY